MLVKVFRSDVGTVGPDEGVELRVNRELSEYFQITQRLEDWSAEHGSQVDLASCTVTKPNPDEVSTDVPRFEYVIVHDVTLAAQQA